MKIWKATLLIGTSDEYSKIQTQNLTEWFEEFEERFKHDFSYIRLKFGEPKFSETVELEEWSYPEHVVEWQEEADSKLDEILNT